MGELERHLIHASTSIKEALARLNTLGDQLTLFVVDDQRKLLGAVTDGDIRRALLQNDDLYKSVSSAMNTAPRYFNTKALQNTEIRDLRSKGIFLVPIVNKEKQVQEIMDLRHIRTTLPIDAVLMAGGRGDRLRPLTDETPKPLLKVGEKPIIEHTLDHLKEHGIENFHVSVNYKKEMIKEHLSNGVHGDKLKFLEEDIPLGTAGALALIEEGKNDAVLLMNSDLLTDLDIEDLYLKFTESGADMAVATSEHEVQIPYAVLDLDGDQVKGFQEKPTERYSCNAGIYLIKRKLLERIPKGEAYNATDLLEDVMNAGGKIIAYPISGYWMDIGRHDDLKKARYHADQKAKD